ncbi:MAG: hypothetical protein ABR553_10835 [Gammaproteobacteria bacterium]
MTEAGGPGAGQQGGKGFGADMHQLLMITGPALIYPNLDRS